jgi:multiple sugar transport system substrate-binding protein
MAPSEELSDEQIAAFTADNPNITIERVDSDPTKLAAMIAAGTAPDIIRGSGADVPLYVQRGWVMDLTSYFQNSSVIKLDDMAPANTYFNYNGKWYGMMKDWSPDFAFIINKRMAEAAGITLPPPNTIITYRQMGEWAKLMTVMDGDRVVTMGNEGIGGDGDVQNILRETGQDLYSADFTHASIKDNPTVVEFLTYAAQLAKDGYTYSPKNPSPGWGVPDLEGGQVASMQMGYWCQAQFAADAATSVEKPSDFVMYPALSWGGTKVSDPSAGGAGWFISATTKNPDAAWKLFEYYMAGQPAIDRASSGWGVPALKSLMTHMDTPTDWQKQFLATVNWEIANADTTARRLDPYYSTNTFNDIWSAQLEQYLNGTITIDQAITNLDTEVNKAIADGMAATK